MKNQTNSTYAKLTNLNNSNETATLDFVFGGITKAAMAVGESNESLLERVHMGDEGAITDLVRKNLPMIADIAVKNAASAADFLDLFQDGIEGLCNAIKGFAFGCGSQFSSYAYPIVEREMLERKLERGAFCRMPQGTNADIRKIERCIADWQADYQTCMQPSAEDIAEATGLTVSRVFELQTLRARRDFLDAPVGSDDEAGDTWYLRDTIAGSVEADSRLKIREIRDIVEGVLSGMSERDAQVFRSLHGDFFDLDCKDANEVAVEIGRTAALVRTINQRALRALAACPAVQSLLGAA